ncbi:MAG TPA: DNA cytosine methyltransferase [Candidatus Nitrosocosmicus sp.]|nr:DNA cytosine methyltransferase [Candidatus Nitrosocosmicus sp.]
MIEAIIIWTVQSWEGFIPRCNMKIISLYSGADNLGDGVIQAGFKIKLCVEMNKDCCETIKLNHPDIEIINDKVSNVLTTLPKADCIIGGPPCPEFSRAKSDRTFDLCEVNNFRKAIELTGATHHFMENVQDLYQVHKERNFLINCADYGVPQTRIRRIFTDLPLPKATHSQYPSHTLFEEPMKKWISIKEALNLNDDLMYISPGGFKNKNKELISREINEPIQTIVNGNEYLLTNYPIKSIKYIRNKNPIMYDKHKPNLLTSPCSTITAKDRSTPSDMVTNGKVARKLTNEELSILQGFRTDFKFYGGKTSVRKQIGNALPAAVSKAFFLELQKMILAQHN